VASLYPKKRSPFWYIRYADPLTGKPRDESTKLLRDDREQTRKARQLCAQYTANELAAPRANRGEDWSWVESFFVVHYPNPLTLKRARAAWFALDAYLRIKRIPSPRLLNREHCADYIAWRTTSPQLAELGLRKAKHNTGRVELQFLSAIMREAVFRKKADANPCLQLGIKRAAGKIKPEITDDQIPVIEERLKSERGKNPHNEAMQIAWDIAMLHLCRLRETCVPLQDVDLVEETITFHTKGGRDQTKMLHPELMPLFRRLKSEGKRFAYDMPNNWSKIWKYFFARCGFPDLSFHCIRVTGVNTLRRRGVDPRVARDYVGHSSVIVHRGYERWRPEDHVAAVNALSRTRSRRSSSSARSRKK
jgi:hypothetical protein